MLALAGSAFGVLAAEPLYLLVDTAVVGHLGSRPLAALGVGAALMSLVVFVATFVEYGTTARAARWYGAGDRRGGGERRRAGVVARGRARPGRSSRVSEVFAGPLTRALGGGDGAVQHAAASWFRIAVLGVPGGLLVLAGNGWMRGVQQTRTPGRHRAGRQRPVGGRVAGAGLPAAPRAEWLGDRQRRRAVLGAPGSCGRCAGPAAPRCDRPVVATALVDRSGPSSWSAAIWCSARSASRSRS